MVQKLIEAMSDITGRLFGTAVDNDNHGSITEVRWLVSIQGTVFLFMKHIPTIKPCLVVEGQGTNVDKRQ